MLIVTAAINTPGTMVWCFVVTHDMIIPVRIVVVDHAKTLLCRVTREWLSLLLQILLESFVVSGPRRSELFDALCFLFGCRALFAEAIFELELWSTLAAVLAQIAADSK